MRGAVSEVDEVRTRLYILKWFICVTVNINSSFFIVDGEILYPRLELFYRWLLNRTISVRVLANIRHNDSMNNLRSNCTFMYLLKYVTCVRNYREMDSEVERVCCLQYQQESCHRQMLCVED